MTLGLKTSGARSELQPPTSRTPMNLSPASASIATCASSRGSRLSTVMAGRVFAAAPLSRRASRGLAICCRLADPTTNLLETIFASLQFVDMLDDQGMVTQLRKNQIPAPAAALWTLSIASHRHFSRCRTGDSIARVRVSEPWTWTSWDVGASYSLSILVSFCNHGVFTNSGAQDVKAQRWWRWCANCGYRRSASLEIV